MQDFIATYGLWLLIALAVIAVLAFLLKGKDETKASDAPSAPAVKAVRAEPAPPPPAPAAEPAAPPVTAAPKAAAPASGEPDNLLQIKGIGPKVNGILIGLGFTRFEQIAAWSDADLAEIDKHLGNFAGRPTRDQWMDQAAYLAKGDIAGFEAKYGKL
jgi:predicted flap endonuclease-1-like 5' DNA nuclease